MNFMKMDGIYLKKCLILFIFSFSFSLNIYAELNDNEVKSLIQQFAITDKSDENYRDHEEVIKELIQSKNPRILDFLIVSLYSNNYRIRYGIIKTLESLGAPLSIEPLGKLLIDDKYWRNFHDNWPRIYTLEIFDSIKDPRVIEYLIESLKSEDGGIQSRSIEILGKKKNKKAIKPLLFIAKDTLTETSLRVKAIQSLGQIGDSIVVNPLIDILEEKPDPEIRSAVVRTICSFPNKKMVSTLIKELKIGNRSTKWIAAKTLGEIGDTSAVMHLIDLINDKDVRFGATEALGKIGDKRAVGPLVSILKTTPPCSISTAVEALGKIGDTSSINALANIYTDTNIAKSPILVVPFLNCTAARALAQTNSVRAARIIIEGFKQIEDNRTIDYNDIRRILREITPKSVDTLVKILRTENIKYKDWASEALARLGSKSVDSLLLTLTDEDPAVRKYSIRALKEIGDSKATVPLMLALRKEDNSKVKRQIAKALGCIGYHDKATVDSLLKVLKDKDSNLRREAAFALMITKEERAIEPLTSALNDNDFGVRIAAAHSLTRMGRDTKTLIKALKNKYTVVRWIAAYEIGERKDPAAIKPLLECMKEETTYDEEETEKIIKDLNIDLYSKDDYCSPSHIRSRFCSYGRPVKTKDEPKDGQFAACCVLGELKAKEAVKPLIKALKHEKDYIRAAAAWSLGEIKDKRATKPLVESLKDKSEEVRRSTYWALVGIRDEKAVEPLISLLKDKNPEVRKEAIDILHWFEDSRILKPLKYALKDKDEGVQAAAAKALIYKGESSFVTQFLQKDKEENKEIKDGTTLPLESIKKSHSIEDLVKLLGAKNSRVRSRAFSALKDFDKMEVVKFLIIALVEHNETGRETAFHLLNDLGLNTYKSFISEDFRDYLLNIKLTNKKMSAEEKCGYILMEAATGEKEKVRENALEVIKRLNNPAVNKNFVEFLISRLKDDSPEVRSAIAYVLGESRNPKAVVPLIDLLEDEDESVCRSAVAALGKIKDKSAIPALIEASNTKNIDLMNYIIYHLSFFGVYAVDKLIESLNHESRLIRMCAAATLGGIEDKKAVEPLINSLKDDDSCVRKEATDALGMIEDLRAVKPLIEALNDKSDMVVEGAIQALSRIGDTTATEPLLLLLDSKNPEIRKNAAYALGNIKDTKAIEPLINLLDKERDPGIRKAVASSLGKLNDPRVIKPLIKLLDKTNDPDTRKAIARALGGIKDPEVTEPLIKLLDDNERDTQWAAVHALRKVGDVRALKPLKNFMKDKDERMKEHTEEAIAKIKKRISVQNYDF
jgi:HEAT repeat protein